MLWEVRSPGRPKDKDSSDESWLRWAGGRHHRGARRVARGNPAGHRGPQTQGEPRNLRVRERRENLARRALKAPSGQEDPSAALKSGRFRGPNQDAEGDVELVYPHLSHQVLLKILHAAN